MFTVTSRTASSDHNQRQPAASLGLLLFKSLLSCFSVYLTNKTVCFRASLRWLRIRRISRDTRSSSGGGEVCQPVSLPLGNNISSYYTVNGPECVPSGKTSENNLCWSFSWFTWSLTKYHVFSYNTS